MKLTSFQVVFILNIVIIVEGKSLRSLSNQISDDPRKCVYNQTTLNIGDSILMDDRCAKLTCLDGTLKAFTCGKIIPNEGCKIETDLSKSYPLCCPLVVCEGELYLNKYRTKREEEGSDSDSESDEKYDDTDSDSNDDDDNDYAIK